MLYCSLLDELLPRLDRLDLADLITLISLVTGLLCLQRLVNHNRLILFPFFIFHTNRWYITIISFFSFEFGCSDISFLDIFVAVSIHIGIKLEHHVALLFFGTIWCGVGQFDVDL